jgi:hypothetical protein
VTHHWAAPERPNPTAKRENTVKLEGDKKGSHAKDITYKLRVSCHSQAFTVCVLLYS